MPQAARQTQCGQDLRGRKLSGSERKLSKEVGSHGLSASLRLEGVGGLLVVAGLGPRIVREDIAGFKGRPPAPAATRSLGLGLGGGRHGNFGKMALPVRESLPLAVRRREPERGQSRYSGGSTGPEGHGGAEGRRRTRRGGGRRAGEGLGLGREGGRSPAVKHDCQWAREGEQSETQNR